tara:strand:+ start:413 stop:664 length:252 start_codon:yes stop_codon:yes gene_type:complete
MRIIAALDEAVGKATVKSPASEVLSPPKSKIITEGSPEALSLNNKPPRAVIEDELQVVSAKSVNAVVLLVVGSTRVSSLPLAV